MNREILERELESEERDLKFHLIERLSYCILFVISIVFGIGLICFFGVLGMLATKFLIWFYGVLF